MVSVAATKATTTSSRFMVVPLVEVRRDDARPFRFPETIGGDDLDAAKRRASGRSYLPRVGCRNSGRSISLLNRRSHIAPSSSSSASKNNVSPTHPRIERASPLVRVESPHGQHCAGEVVDVFGETGIEQRVDESGA